MKINTNLVTTIPQLRKTKDNQLKKNKNTFTFDKSRKHVYIQALKDDPNVEILRSALAQVNTTSDRIDMAISRMNNVLLNAAKKASFTKKSRSIIKDRRHTHEWYNKECKANQRILRQYSRKLSQDPFDREMRHNYVKARTKYKKVCRKAEAECRQKLTQKLIRLGQNDPKQFWNTIKEMNNWGKKNNDPTDDIDTDTWIKYFKNLLNEDHPQMKPTEDIFIPTFEPTLDRRITLKELQEALGNLKSGKAAGPDEILGEYLKLFGENFEDILLRLVNVIFYEQIYPSQWTLNFLKPIFKKDSSKDPDNYRGLAIGSTFSKLFSFILLKRLIEFIDIKKLISPGQIGFMKGKGTSDHIFLLQTIVEKVVKKNKKKIYTAFIDFKKAYDTVNRKLLMKKLKSLGINGIFMRNIEAMYQKTDYCLKLKGGHTSAIKSNLGLKQGCPLSPMLFNLYIDDIKDIFDDLCDPIPIQNVKLNHFLYADDLVILSGSKAGLQTCLDKASDFAKTKRLTISVKKSKTMIFNTAGKFIRDTFTLENKTLEPVQTFCYLGVDIKCSGTVKHAMNVLNDKGNKALRPLLNAIARFKIPVKTSIKLFHSYISPILLYNTENASIFTDKEIRGYNNEFIFDDITDSKTDTTHRKFLKFIMGVSKSCPNLAIYGDTGEIPLSLKSWRLTLNFWHRVSNLQGMPLVKMALLENIELRTNWITTIEKLINTLQLADKIGNHNRFKKATKLALENRFQKWWKKSLGDHNLSRLKFYKKFKLEYGTEKYLDMPDFKIRRYITKLRCSDHSLEIEKGRHKRGNARTEVKDRICVFCGNGEVEDEEHFLFKCNIYTQLRSKHHLDIIRETSALFTEEYMNDLGNYLIEAFKMRDDLAKLFTGSRGGGQ